jgi:hypothetical protein
LPVQTVHLIRQQHLGKPRPKPQTRLVTQVTGIGIASLVREPKLTDQLSRTACKQRADDRMLIGIIPAAEGRERRLEDVSDREALA